MNELNRIRTEYDRRAQDAQLQIKYSPFNVTQLFFLQTQERLLLKLLKRYNLYPLSQSMILDVGCGSGSALLNMVGYGATVTKLFGIDLLTGRIQQAKNRQQPLGLVQADGSRIPFATSIFDLVFQFTVFTSVLDPALKGQIAAEMLRVLKPEGLIIWYDFWPDNPRNPQVKGVKPAEIKRLFPNCTFEFQRTTLAPPLARRVVPLSWLLAELLAKIPWLLSHYFVVIRKA